MSLITRGNCSIKIVFRIAGILLLSVTGIPATQALPNVAVTIVHSFQDGSVPGDRSNPQAGLIRGTDGNLYGTTSGGGGTVYKIIPSGQMTVLHAFPDSGVANDGQYPDAPLIQGTDGNFYGTTTDGGAAGEGTVFKITPAGQVTILHSFGDNSVLNDGQFPQSGLVQGTDGNFYGAVKAGGSAGQGVLYKITPAGQVTILHSFVDGSVTNDGEEPIATALVQGSDGNFYGTTFHGGSVGNGTAFKMTPAGQMTILHSFGDLSVDNDGILPWSGLVLGPDGSFYGTTYAGGSASEGVIFKMTSSGQVTVLHSFGDGSVVNDGFHPTAPLILGTDGNFYGTASGGSTADGWGVVFKMTPAGQVTILHSFRDGSVANDAAGPLAAALVQAADGSFYGTTPIGGSADKGAIFKVTRFSTTLAAPAGLTATAGDRQITLSWTASAGAARYNVKRAAVSGGPYATIASPLVNSYVNTGLTNGLTTYYVVSVVNGTGESANSNQASATPAATVSSPPIDFNGDGKTDLILQNTTNNQVAVWFMNAAAFLSSSNVSLIPGTGWAVAGCGDFNGDGKPDLVLQNAALNKAAIWYLNGTTLVSGQYVSLTIPAGWTIAAVGDFNGDGKPDIVLQNTSTNKAAIWYMNGATVTSGAYVSLTVAGWRVAGAGDFNGDGKTDLVLQGTANNKAAIWYMNGATVTSGVYVNAIPPAGWSVVGVGDFNGDGKPDLVLQNASTNQVALWYMNGASVTGGVYLSSTPSPGWHVVGPR